MTAAYQGDRLLLPAVLRNRDFRLFTGGQGLSVLGTEFTTVAMGWQIYQLTDSPLDVGLLGLARALPQMALMLFGGLLADRFDRRKLMMAVQGGQFLVSASLALLSAHGLVSPGTLLVMSALLAVFTAVETPCRQAFVPNLVERRDLSSAVALTNTLRKTGSVAGPSLAGLVLAFASPAWCYAVDAASWLVMLGALMLIAARPDGRSMQTTISLRALQDGLAFVVSHPIILSVMALDFGATLFATPNALFPVYARDILQVGPQGLGVLYAATSIGAILGALGMSTLHGVRRAGVGVLVGVTVYGIANVFFAASPLLWLSAVLLAIAGIGNAISAVLRWTISQLLTPDELRGRVSAANSVFTLGGPRLGEFRAGVVAELFGAQASALTGGIATLVLVAGLALVPAVRRFDLRAATERQDATSGTAVAAARA
jgi:MFS family permease